METNWSEIIIAGIVIFVFGWIMGHIWFMRLTNRLKNLLTGLLDRCEAEYLKLVDQEVEKKHNRDTYFMGFKACYREVDSLLMRLW